MADKTKAELQAELKAATKKLAKAEKALDQAHGEAETGVGEAQSFIDDLNETVTRLRAERNDWRSFAGGAPGMRDSSKMTKSAQSTPTHGDHVCPRTGAALNADKDVYSTEARLRSERNAWREACGGSPGQRGPSASVSVPFFASTEPLSDNLAASLASLAGKLPHNVKVTIN